MLTSPLRSASGRSGETLGPPRRLRIYCKALYALENVVLLESFGTYGTGIFFIQKFQTATHTAPSVHAKKREVSSKNFESKKVRNIPRVRRPIIVKSSAR